MAPVAAQSKAHPPGTGHSTAGDRPARPNRYRDGALGRPAPDLVRCLS